MICTSSASIYMYLSKVCVTFHTHTMIEKDQQLPATTVGDSLTLELVTLHRGAQVFQRQFSEDIQERKDISPHKQINGRNLFVETCKKSCLKGQTHYTIFIKQTGFAKLWHRLLKFILFPSVTLMGFHSYLWNYSLSNSNQKLYSFLYETLYMTNIN